MTMSNLRLRHPGTADRTPVAALILTRRGTREWFRAFSRAAGTRSSANELAPGIIVPGEHQRLLQQNQRGLMTEAGES